MSQSAPGPTTINYGDRWLLPVGVEETLPAEAALIEQLRRRSLDLLSTWGYELVMPPLMEYLDSLLTGLGSNLEIETFKLTDQMSGKMMGVRADMTPQVARIDAHYLRRSGPSRLCYFGPVLRTRPDCLGCSRVPLQLGAELFGVNSSRADIEILELLVETLNVIGLQELHVDLGHMGIFQGLANAENLDSAAQEKLASAISCRAKDDVLRVCQGLSLSTQATELFVQMTVSSGEVETLPAVADKFSAAATEVRQAIENLQSIAGSLKKRIPGVRLYYDLSALKGQSYHNGIVFSVYTPGSGRAIASGGRYDDIGIAFGRSRPATGFSLDLRAIAGLISTQPAEAGSIATICASYEEDPELFAVVRQLRLDGKRVVYCYDNEEPDTSTENMSRLLKKAGKWIIE